MPVSNLELTQPSQQLGSQPASAPPTGGFISLTLDKPGPHGQAIIQAFATLKVADLPARIEQNKTEISQVSDSIQRLQRKAALIQVMGAVLVVATYVLILFFPEKLGAILIPGAGIMGLLIAEYKLAKSDCNHQSKRCQYLQAETATAEKIIKIKEEEHLKAVEGGQ